MLLQLFGFLERQFACLPGNGENKMDNVCDC